MTTEPLDKYTEICRDAIKCSSAKLDKTFENLLVGNTLIVHGDTKKDKFHSNGVLRHPLRADLQNEFQPQPGLVHQLG